MSELVVPVGCGAHLRVATRLVAACLLLVLVGLGACFAGLCYGDGWSDPREVLAALGGGGDLWFQVTRWRAPRVAAGLLFGAALGLAGAILQNLVRNPLGTPDVIGLDQGAYAGVLLVLAFGSALPTSTGLSGALGLGTAGAAFLGGLVAAALIASFAAGRGYSGLRLIVIGIAVNAILTAWNSWIVLRIDLDTAIAATAWSAGSLNGIDWHELMLPTAAIGALGLALLTVARPLQQLALGDDVAAAAGVELLRLRVMLVAVGVGFTAVVAAAAGPIIFVALAAPQIGRRLAGVAGVRLLPAALTGAVLLVAADVAAQFVVAPVVLPVGVVTSAIGGLYLLWLLLKEVR